MDVERALFERASIDSLIPADGEVSLVNLLDDDAAYFETSRRLIPLKRRELLFVDEKLRCFAALQVPRCEQPVLDRLLSRAEFKIDVWAFDKAPRDEEAAKDLIFSTSVSNIQDPVVLVQTRTAHGAEEEVFTLLWEAEVTLHRPRIRMSHPSIYLYSLLVVERPGPGSTRDGALMKPFTPMEPNVLEPMQHLVALNGRSPYLAASRLERAMSSASTPSIPFRLEHMSAKYRLVPAANARVRFSQPNPAPHATTVIASLDIEMTPFVQIDAEVEKVEVTMASGQIENLMPGFVPLKCRSGDLVTYLWRLKLAPIGSPPATPAMPRASMMVDAVVDGNLVYAMHHSNTAPPPADLVSLTAELRIGPLQAGQCHETKLEMVAFKAGVLRVDAMRVIDKVREAEEGMGAAGVITDFRDLPDVIVEEGPAGDLSTPITQSPVFTMAALSSGPVPIVKVEDDVVKDEPMEDDAVPYMDDPDDEGGDLDFSAAKQDVWLGHVPRTLWGVLSKLGTVDDDNEIEIGTIRVEGPESRPQRVSLLLNSNIAQFSTHHKEYNLFETQPTERRAKRKGGTVIFSEQDVPGYQARRFNFNDVDDQGNPVQANSKLFEKWKRSQNNKKRRADKEAGAEDTPQPQRWKIPKKTAIQGVISREFDVKPVKNADYLAIEALQTGSMLHQKKKQEAVLIQSLDHVIQIEGTADQLKQNRDAVRRRQMREREDRKANQYQRLERPALQSLLHQLFARHKVWPFKELRLETKQPADYLKSVLEEIAFQPAKGDWAGKWVMKEEYRNTHLADLQDLHQPHIGQQMAPDGGSQVASNR
ncbi:hypothetical protein DV738_g3218, partial [Chaetothyriales sp. CBS 135597]